MRISPSLVTAWLACPHYLNLRIQGAQSSKVGASTQSSAIPPLDEEEASQTTGVPTFASILKERGLLHEKNALERLKAQGADVLECSVSRDDLEEKAKVYLAEKALNHEVVYQMPFVHDGMRGIADFVIQEGDGHLAVDTKLARNSAKPGHVLQLCFYTDAIEQATGRRPTHVEIWLGGLGEDGGHKVERHRIKDVDAYWRRMKNELKRAIDNPVETVAEPCSHCQFCEYADLCTEQWVKSDSVHFISGVTKRDREKLGAAGIESRSGLASLTSPVDGMDEVRLARLSRQAQLQVEALPRLDEIPENFPNSSMRVEFIEPDPEGLVPEGLHALPPPDEGDVFLDYEGHPFWTVEEGLIFLFGLLFRKAGEWTYEGWWAHSKDEERKQSNELVKWISERRAKHPGMHVYHYNHTERSNLSSLVRDGGSDELGEVLNELKGEEVFVDLLQIIRKGIQVGVSSYGLKNIEKVAGYRRPEEDSVGRGADAVTFYEAWMKDGRGTSPHPLLDSIREYNEQDVLATRHVRDWLVSLRPAAGVKAWPTRLVVDTLKPIDVEEERLLEFPLGSPERLLGDVYGYWRRESAAESANLRIILERNIDDLLEDRRTIGDISIRGSREVVDDKGKTKSEIEISWRPQNLDRGIAAKTELCFLCADGQLWNSKIVELTGSSAFVEDQPRRDKETGEVTFPLRSGLLSATPHTWFPFDNKVQQLRVLASSWIDGQSSSFPLSRTLLAANSPDAPVGGFGSEITALADFVIQMSGQVLAVQGPPGTGKTFTGAEIIKELLRRSETVSIGVVATSHNAVDNLLKELRGTLDPADLVRVGRVPASGDKVPEFLKSPKGVKAAPAQEKRQVVFGAVSVFCSQKTAERVFDVVFVDEAGQMSLGDALAVSVRAKSMVLLGDPLQLPQVSQASHPNGAGASVLEHFLAGEETISAQRGVFLEVSRRMHPSICDFISSWRYEDRLRSFEECRRLATTVDSLELNGTGLRVKLLNHSGNRDTSPEEVAEVVQIVNSSLGKTWTHRDGSTSPIGPEDVLIVAPFNAHKDAIREALSRDKRTAGIAVGTVDKFQGREAPIVIFSMAASSAEDLTRNADFLFNSNRLNVAISRAKCLAYLVCNEPLLSSRARSVEQMKLISGLCSFVEAATPI